MRRSGVEGEESESQTVQRLKTLSMMYQSGFSMEPIGNYRYAGTIYI